MLYAVHGHYPDSGLRSNRAWSYKPTGAGTSDPAVDLNSLKEFLKVSHSQEDALIQDLEEAARDLFTKKTGLVMMETQFETHRDFFDLETVLRRGPFVSIDDIQYKSDGSFKSFGTDNFVVSEEFPWVRLALKPDVSVPDDKDYTVSSVKITFTAGHASQTSDVPKDLKLLIKQMVSFFHKNRSDCPDEDLPMSLRRKLKSYQYKGVHV